MNALITALLEEYKRLNGITDDSQDELLSMLLESALEIAKQKACKWSKWDKFEDIPKPIILGIITLVQLMQTRNSVSGSGIKSESIGGMSQSFFGVTDFSDDSFFAPAYDLFDLYCGQKQRNKQFVFKKAKRGRGCGC